MGWLDVFATIAYAGWTAAVLATIGVILAEYRASRDPIWLLVLLTAGLQLVGSATLTITSQPNQGTTIDVIWKQHAQDA